MLLLALLPSALATEPVHRRLTAMGTWLEVQVWAEDRPTALAASEAAVRAIEATEARLTTWREGGELMRFLDAPVGVWVPLSDALAADLALASWCWRETAGGFDPSVGALVEAWGLRDGGRTPTEAERDAALARTGLDHLELDGTRARRRVDLRLDTGGFGKGIGLDAGLAAARAAGATAVLLDLGGQVAVSGTPLRVDVADPDDRARAVATRTLSTGSASTSGHSEQPGHLLDPRTGAPTPDFGSVTVFSPSAAVADCLSTGLYVLGPERALAWSAGRTDVEVVVVRRDSGGAVVHEAGSLPPPDPGGDPR